MPYKNPEDKKEYDKLYRENHRGMLEEYMKNYYRSHQAHINAKNKSWYEANKDHVSEYEKKRYAKYKTKIIAYQKERLKDPEIRERHNMQVRGYRQRDRLLVLGHYSNGKVQCACCKEKTYEFLTIDHIDGGGCKHRKQEGYGHLYRWLMANNFPPGYRVLCWNCNSSVKEHGICAHKNKS